MTEFQKAIIQKLRAAGKSYAEIGAATGLSVGTIKAFCSRNAVEASQVTIPRCEFCGAEIARVLKHKPKRFCSDRCRYRWWNKTRDKLAGNGTIRVCAHCKKEYPSYDNESKYCSHSCYIAQRFGKGAGRP